MPVGDYTAALAMAAPTGPVSGSPYGRDFGETLRKYVVKWTSAFRLNPSVQPVTIFADEHYIPRPLQPTRGVGGNRLAAPGAGAFAAIVLTCNVDTLLRYGYHSVISWLISTPTSGLGAFYTNLGAVPIVNIGDPLKPPINLLSHGTSIDDLSLFGGVPLGAAASTSTPIPDWFVPAGFSVFIQADTAATAASLGLEWIEYQVGTGGGI